MMRFYVTEHLSENMAETPEGYLLCSNVPITRTGEFLYRGDELLGEDGKPIVESSDGVVRIQREADYVFADNTVKSFEGKPFTLDHPDGFVSPDNWQKLTHGVIQNVRPGEGEFDGYLLADILVTTDKAKELIRAGEREISCGYDAEYEQVEKGIGRQTNIIGNHVALVVKGRAGSRCAIADKDGTITGTCDCGETDKNNDKEALAMVGKKSVILGQLKKWFDSRPFKDEDDLEKLLEEEEAKKADDVDEDDDKKKTEDDETIESLQAELAELKGNYVSLEEKVDGILEILEVLLEEEEEEETGTTDSDDDDEEDDGKKKTDDSDEDEEELKEKEEAEKKEVEDAWPGVLSHADILVPGIKLNKPTKDYAAQLDGIRASVLTKASTDSEYGDAVKALCTAPSFKAMTHDALSVAFVAASKIVGDKRNAKVQSKTYTQKSTKDHKFGTAQAIAEINQRNREKYQRQ